MHWQQLGSNPVEGETQPVQHALDNRTCFLFCCSLQLDYPKMLLRCTDNKQIVKMQAYDLVTELCATWAWVTEYSSEVQVYAGVCCCTYLQRSQEAGRAEPDSTHRFCLHISHNSNAQPLWPVMLVEEALHFSTAQRG